MRPASKQKIIKISQTLSAGSVKWTLPEVQVWHHIPRLSSRWFCFCFCFVVVVVFVWLAGWLVGVFLFSFGFFCFCFFLFCFVCLFFFFLFCFVLFLLLLFFFPFFFFLHGSLSIIEYVIMAAGYALGKQVMNAPPPPPPLPLLLPPFPSSLKCRKRCEIVLKRLNPPVRFALVHTHSQSQIYGN